MGEVTQQAVSRMLIRSEERTLKEMSAKIKTKKVRQEAALWKIYYAALAAWEESKKPQKSLTTKHGPSDNNGQPGKVLESHTTLRDQDGDPPFSGTGPECIGRPTQAVGTGCRQETRSDRRGWRSD
jgi:hypothetical protein